VCLNRNPLSTALPLHVGSKNISKWAAMQSLIFPQLYVLSFLFLLEYSQIRPSDSMCIPRSFEDNIRQVPRLVAA
jgi:hypothetical protein